MSNHLQEHVPSKAYLSLLYTGHVIEKLIKETESSQTYNLWPRIFFHSQTLLLASVKKHAALDQVAAKFLDENYSKRS